jgi:uncharacterized OB-fold protein
MDMYAQEFWEFTKNKELRLQKCTQCGKFRFPAGPTCDRCLNDEYTWEKLSGNAKIISWTTFRRGYFPEYPPPHTAIALELEEGPLFISFPVGVNAPDDLKVDMKMQLEWTDGEDRFGEYNLPVFRPA